MKPQKTLHLHLEEAKKKPKLSHDYMVSEKYDGWYVYSDFDKYTGWGEVTSMAGRVIPSMTHCRREILDKLPNPRGNCRLIMEATIPDTPFHILNGVFNRSKGECQARDVVFKAHDLIFFNEICPTALLRSKKLSTFLETGKTDKIQGVSTLAITSDKGEWLKIFDIITYNGGEGIVLKQADGTYQAGKRNSSLMKIKLEDTLALHCMGVKETFGGKGNRNLNLLLKRKSGVDVTVRVGKHSDIAAIDTDNSYIVGKVVAVKCMKELENGSLREPRFVEILHSKTIEEID